ncbi:MAG: DUF4167 domain-containing protein [Parvibaculum sp.]
MRQGQNNNSKRSRGRGRKPQHSANRSYDSNGPDVKIRGTAAHICEKYQQLARDAISAGDRVTAENFYQHAEHYYRLLMAAQQGQEGQQRQQSNLGYRPDEDEEVEQEFAGEGPQPRYPGQPFHQQNGNGYASGNGHESRNESRNENRHENRGDSVIETASAEEEAPVAEVASPEAAPAGDATAAAGEGETEAAPRRRAPRRRRPRADAPRDAAPAESGAAE